MPRAVIYFSYLNEGRLFETVRLYRQGAYFFIEKQPNEQIKWMSKC